MSDNEKTAAADDLKLPATPPKADNRLNWIGAALTGAWLIGFAVYGFLAQGQFTELTPNEVGDFLAGLSAPLAFLWLVLGFLQQGKELRHSGEALWLQGRELQHSVEQQRQLVEVTREQLQFESARLAAEREESVRAAQPILELKGGGSIPGNVSTSRIYAFRVFNHGRPCADVKVFGNERPLSAAALLASGQRVEFSLTLDIKEDAEIDVRISYRDALLTERSVLHRIIKSGPDFTFMEL
jgi:hypothetical protein